MCPTFRVTLREVRKSVHQLVLFPMQEAMIPMCFQPLTEGGLNHTEVNHSAYIVQRTFTNNFSSYICTTVNMNSFTFRLWCNMKVEDVVVPVQVAAFTFMTNYTVASANFMRTDYFIRHWISPLQ
jgi:hypothetical protein